MFTKRSKWMTVSPYVTALDGRQVACTQARGRTGPRNGCKIQRAKFGIFVPPRIADPGTRFQQRVVIQEK